MSRQVYSSHVTVNDGNNHHELENVHSTYLDRIDSRRYPPKQRTWMEFIDDDCLEVSHGTGDQSCDWPHQQLSMIPQRSSSTLMPPSAVSDVAFTPTVDSSINEVSQWSQRGQMTQVMENEFCIEEISDPILDALTFDSDLTIHGFAEMKDVSGCQHRYSHVFPSQDDLTYHQVPGVFRLQQPHDDLHEKPRPAGVPRQRFASRRQLELVKQIAQTKRQLRQKYLSIIMARKERQQLRQYMDATSRMNVRNSNYGWEHVFGDFEGFQYTSVNKMLCPNQTPVSERNDSNKRCR
jgi:hypothetical protein